ncbi:MAG: hypothetical protein V3V45_08700 [Candidatus Brocadiales bacterium]
MPRTLEKGEPLNYFIYPYVEVDGVPHEDRALSRTRTGRGVSVLETSRCR